jgi:hypothetical protein
MTASEMQRLSTRARMRRLTPEERSAIARRAALARWKKPPANGR